MPVVIVVLTLVLVAVLALMPIVAVQLALRNSHCLQRKPRNCW